MQYGSLSLILAAAPPSSWIRRHLPAAILLLGLVALSIGVALSNDEITPAEERAYSEQVEFAKDNDCVVMVHSPHRDKKRGIRRSLDVDAVRGIESD